MPRTNKSIVSKCGQFQFHCFQNCEPPNATGIERTEHCCCFALQSVSEDTLLGPNANSVYDEGHGQGTNWLTITDSWKCSSSVAKESRFTSSLHASNRDRVQPFIFDVWVRGVRAFQRFRTCLKAVAFRLAVWIPEGLWDGAPEIGSTSVHILLSNRN